MQVRIISCAHEVILQAARENLRHALRVSLLMLPPTFTAQELYMVSECATARRASPADRTCRDLLTSRTLTSIYACVCVPSALRFILCGSWNTSFISARHVRHVQTIAGLSYTGDFRMVFGENPNKVANIVLKSLDHFHSLYSPVLEV